MDTSEREKMLDGSQMRRGARDAKGGFGVGWAIPYLFANNNNSSNTLLAALLMYFQAKTSIFASCVIYCGSHLHIKALISPSERVCEPVYVFVCE